MFGLMKPISNCKADSSNNFRAHYCGTCKSIGSLYGQKERLFVNYDVAFLGEIMTSIEKPDFKINELSKPYRSLNCFSLPENEDIPLVLDYTATLNVILGVLKIDDNIQDERKLGFLWRFLKMNFSRSFKKLSPELGIGGFH